MTDLEIAIAIIGLSISNGLIFIYSAYNLHKLAKYMRDNIN